MGCKRRCSRPAFKTKMVFDTIKKMLCRKLSCDWMHQKVLHSFFQDMHQSCTNHKAWKKVFSQYKKKVFLKHLLGEISKKWKSNTFIFCYNFTALALQGRIFSVFNFFLCIFELVEIVDWKFSWSCLDLIIK